MHCMMCLFIVMAQKIKDENIPHPSAKVIPIEKYVEYI